MRFSRARATLLGVDKHNLAEAMTITSSACFRERVIFLQPDFFAINPLWGFESLVPAFFNYPGWPSLRVLCQICRPFLFCAEFSNVRLSDADLSVIWLFDDAAGGALFSRRATRCQNSRNDVFYILVA